MFCILVPCFEFDIIFADFTYSRPTLVRILLFPRYFDNLVTPWYRLYSYGIAPSLEISIWEQWDIQRLPVESVFCGFGQIS